MKSEATIRSRYTKRVEIFTETGRPMHNNYQIRVNETGHKTLYKIGEHNLQAEIEAGAAECDIKTMLERYKGGDIEALNKAKAGYVDLTKCPKDLREAQNIVLGLKQEFMTLPVDVRRQFDHSPEKYIAEYGTDKWMKIFNKPKPETIYEDQKKDGLVIEKKEGETVNE